MGERTESDSDDLLRILTRAYKSNIVYGIVGGGGGILRGKSRLPGPTIVC